MSLPADGGNEEATLTALMALGGYDSSTSSLAKELYDIQLNHIVKRLGISADDSVYEVGCGAGSLLFSLQRVCSSVGGCDYARPLVEIARSVIQSQDIHHLEAAEITSTPHYDVLVCNGVFLYFPDAGYARRTVAAMMRKAKRSLGIMDVNDASTRHEFEAVRRQAQGARALDYEGLHQLYLERAFFHELATTHGWTCETEDSVMTDSINGRYRFNAFFYR